MKWPIFACAVALWAADAPEPVYTRVTVTAERGVVRETGSTAQVTHVVTPGVAPTLGHALENAPNILIQSTTPGQVSPFLRGFTGYHVLNLLDGLRFNNTGFRSGPNQYLAFIEPAATGRVEAVLGPASSQFGSDAIGGSINVITPHLTFADALRINGSIGVFGASADLSGGPDARVELSSRRWAWLIGGSTARFNDLRAGGGEDSRNAFLRFFGVSSIGGPRLQDTSYSRFGINTKASLALTSKLLLTGLFQRTALEDVRGYKDLYGGLGRLRSDVDPQRLDFGYLRLGWTDALQATFSVNQQGDGSVRQGLRFTDPIIADRVRIRAYGYTVQASRRLRGTFLLAGGDVHDEHVNASRWQSGVPVRALYPDGSRYTTGAIFAQAATEWRRWRFSYGGRLTRVAYLDQRFSDAAFHTAASYQATATLGLHAIVSRGFRAPNLNDLGSIGLNDLGYEIPAAEAPGALIGASAGEAALPTRRAVEALQPERLMNYEAGLRVRTGRLYSRVQLFNAEFHDPIDRRTLLWPVGAVPSSLAGLPVIPIAQTTEQRVAGVVAVATSFDPRAVKAFVNEGRSRYYGTEVISEARIASAWMLRANYSFLHGRQLNPNRPVRRLPPQQGHLALLYTPASKRYWIEVRGTAAGAQTRLSGGDLDDERIGASRSRRDIAQFYAGALASQYAMRETLAEIQARVLPGVTSETTRVPMYRSTAGWASLDLVGGFRLGESWTLGTGVTNLLDRNYRIHGSGVDAPGANAFVRARYTF